nr:MAG TPA: hypothetical protein [Caudoviricetes sp.]
MILRCGCGVAIRKSILRRRTAACHDRHAAWRSAPPGWPLVSEDCPIAHAGA